MENYERDGESVSMDDVLKRVYSVHRTVLRDSNKKYVVEIRRLTEKVNHLQTQHEQLGVENSRLQNLVSSAVKQGRDGSCCDALRQSFQLMTSSYKDLLVQKDTRIRQLEDYISKYKRRMAPTGSIDLLSSNTQDEISACISRRAVGIPDSTSRTMPRLADDEPTDRDNEEMKTDPEQEEASLGQKLRLQRKRTTRNRYTEDISPEMKRARHISPVSDKNTSTDQSPVNLDQCNKSKSKQKTILPKIIVPDTCYSNLENTLTSQGQDIECDIETATKKGAAKILQRRLDDKKEFDETVMMVPETLAVEYDDVDEFDDVNFEIEGEEVKKEEIKKERIQKYLPELSKISELSASVELGDKDNGDEHDIDGDAEPVSPRDNKKQNNSNMSKGDTKPSTSTATKFSLKSMLLDSPDSDKSTCSSNGETAIDLAINHRTLTLSGSSYVHDSDIDSDNSTLDNLENDHAACSQKFRKSKLKSTSDNIEQVDELFETPYGKCRASSDEYNVKNVDVNNDETDMQSKNKKPLFKKRQIQFEEKNEIILRRSPRKHKEFAKTEKIALKAKTRTKLMNSRKKDHDNNDPDVTILPGQIEEDKEESVENLTENQSVDLCNVFPVTNGVPVAHEKFQLKVPRKRKGISSGKKNNLEKLQIEDDNVIDKIAREHRHVNDNFDDTMKSPSILQDQAVKSQKLRTKDVVMISSPSIGSQSDPKSPLLLKKDKNHESIDTNLGNQNDTEWKSKSETKRKSNSPSFSVTCSKNTRSKSNPAQNRATQGDESSIRFVNKSKTSKVKQDTTNAISLSEVKSKSKNNLHQTTLTQGFFSPGKKQRRKPAASASDNKDLEEAIRLSLEEARNSQYLGSLDDINEDDDAEYTNDVVIIDKQNSAFKRPGGPVKKELRLRKHEKKSIDKAEVNNLDDTLPPSLHVSNVLQEIKSSNITVEGHRLNGSLDPAVELSEWCREPGTLVQDDTEMEVMKSLQSLDAADFCMEDLQPGTQSLPKTSTLADEDSQEIPSSSTSYKFGLRKKLSRKGQSDDQENVKPSTPSAIMNDSFDRPPKKVESKVAHVTVVRKQDERQKLQGHGCKQCLEYYKSAGRDEEEMKQHMQKCSRHRAQYLPPDTPPHFWSVGFIDTQECVDRGYLKIETADNKDPDEPTYRRRRRLNKYFKSKNEASVDDDSQEDLVF